MKTVWETNDLLIGRRMKAWDNGIHRLVYIDPVKPPGTGYVLNQWSSAYGLLNEGSGYVKEFYGPQLCIDYLNDNRFTPHH